MSDTSGLFYPTEIQRRVGSGSWVTATPPDPANSGGVLVAPTSISYTGTSASINMRGSVSFNAVTSISLNGVFTATYDNYMITGRVTNLGSNLDLVGYRYRVGTADDANGVYGTQYIIAASGGSLPSRSSNQSNGGFVYMDETYVFGGSTLHIYGPYLTQPTVSTMVDASSNYSPAMYGTAVVHRNSTSFDGITFYSVASQNFGGLISVYGFKG